MIANLKTLTGEGSDPALDVAQIAARTEDTAVGLDRALRNKQEDLVSPIEDVAYEALSRQWDEGRAAVVAYNDEIAAFCRRIEDVRRAQASAHLDSLKNELAVLQARRKRHEAAVVAIVDERKKLLGRQENLKAQKEELRGKLTAHTNRVTSTLGTTINAYLDRLGAGFQIDYQPPNYKGKEPAAAYSILINRTAVPPRADDIAAPSLQEHPF